MSIQKAYSINNLFEKCSSVSLLSLLNLIFENTRKEEIKKNNGTAISVKGCIIAYIFIYVNCFCMNGNN